MGGECVCIYKAGTALSIGLYLDACYGDLQSLGAMAVVFEYGTGETHSLLTVMAVYFQRLHEIECE